MDVYWKDEQHKKDCEIILSELGITAFDSYYNSFAYLISATGKTDILLKHMDYGGVEYENILKDIEVFSMSEQGMIRFALHLFNAGMVTPSFHDVASRLDSDNYECLINAIEIRYGNLNKKTPHNM